MRMLFLILTLFCSQAIAQQTISITCDQDNNFNKQVCNAYVITTVGASETSISYSQLVPIGKYGQNLYITHATIMPYATGTGTTSDSYASNAGSVVESPHDSGQWKLQLCGVRAGGDQWCSAALWPAVIIGSNDAWCLVQWTNTPAIATPQVRFSIQYIVAP